MGIAWKPMENNLKTHVLRGNQWKTQGKRRCCVGTYGKHKENTGFVMELMENSKMCLMEFVFELKAMTLCAFHWHESLV